MAIPVDNTVRETVSPTASEPPVPRISGFVPHSAYGQRGSNGLAQVTQVGHPLPAKVASVAEAIRGANAELEQRAAQHLTVSLTLALQQRDHFIAELARERESWQQELSRQTVLFDQQIRERETILQQLRAQLQEAERELAHHREEPKTVIGVGPRVFLSPSSSDSGEHLGLQSALETAWQDVEDARSRLAALEAERDDAVKNADELRVELYDKLATARDEVIETETRLSETQRAFDEARETWEAEQARLTADAEETRRALLAQLQANAELRRSLALRSQTTSTGVDTAVHTDAVDTSSAYNGGEPVPLVNASPRPLALQETAFISPPGPHYHTSQIPPAPPAPDVAPSSRRSLSALVGFETASPDNSDEALAAAAERGNELNKRSKGFGLGRLFRSR